MIERPLFYNKEVSSTFSLATAAQVRTSENILAQQYIYSKLGQQNPDIKEETKGVVSDLASTMAEKLVTFRRNEIYFDERKSIMLNVRDITNEETLLVEKKTKQLIETVGS